MGNSRILKFRIPMFSYDGKFKGFSYWGKIEEGWTYRASWTDWMKGDDEQYTGLKDSKGVEIYNGDILRLASYGLNDLCKIQEVRWCEDFAGFITGFNPFIKTNHQRTFTMTCDWIFGSSIIGNIHENPELLK